MTLDEKVFTNKQFGKALELYYKKGYNETHSVGEFLCHVFKINDPHLKRCEFYSDGCMMFKSKYVID